MTTTEKRNMLTTYQACVKIEGYMKPHSLHVLNATDTWDMSKVLTPGESHYPVATMRILLDKYHVGYHGINPETGWIEAKINPAGLPEIWALLERVNLHTTNH